jgi:antitoxin VapB
MPVGDSHAGTKARQTIPQWPQSSLRIPVEFELPGDEAIMHRDGDRLVIEPARRRGLVALLKTMKPLEEVFPEIDDSVPAPEKEF